MAKKKKSIYDGGEMNIILSVPEDAVKIKIKATVLVRDKLEKMETVLDADQITEARKDYLLLDPTDDAFVRYEFTPEFKAFIDEKEAQGYTFEEIMDLWDEERGV